MGMGLLIDHRMQKSLGCILRLPCEDNGKLTRPLNPAMIQQVCKNESNPSFPVCGIPFAESYNGFDQAWGINAG